MNKNNKPVSQNYDFQPDSQQDNNNREINLWKGVIMQAFLDSGTLSNRSEDIVAKKDALQWFSLSNPDFTKICQLAKLEPSYVMKKADIAIRTSCKWRNDILKERRLLKIKQKETVTDDIM